MSDAPPDSMVGATVLGRYRIVARLAAGGMGVVYLARAEGAAGFAKPVVVKRVLPSLNGSEQMARLFIREAKILANLQHPNIVGVIDFGEEDGAYIMVLDYVRAYDLGVWAYYRRNKSEHLPVDGILHIVIKVLEALEYAHTLALPDGTSLDIIHADISPSNVLVDTDGQVKLLDFGIARMRGEVTQSTDSASIRGKFSYLPVEALDGSPPRVTTDVYACGVTLYELLTATNPFLVDDDTVTIARVISHDPPPVSALRAELPPELDAVVARGMARDRTKRFATAKEFARELRRLQRTPEDEVIASLAALARQDYAAMPVMAGISLAELEETWRSPPPSVQSLRRADPVIHVYEQPSKIELALAPTVPPGKTANAARAGAAVTEIAPATVRSAPAEEPPRKGFARPLLLAAGIPLVLGGVGTAIFMYARSRPEPEEPRILLVEHNPTATAPPDSSAPTVKAAGTQSAVSSASAPTRADAKLHAPKTPKVAGDPLSTAFAKTQPEFETCFQQQASGVSGSPEISFRFAIDTDGVVQKVEIAPAELGGVPLGQCILGVARKTKFPAQSAPTTFTISLRARVVP